MNDSKQTNGLSRRAALRFGATGAAGAVGAVMTGKITQGAVTLTPTATEGPFWEDEKLLRSDIRESQAGVPLNLLVTVSKLAGGVGTPLQYAYVDIWHCNAYGAYSDEPAGMGNPNTLGQTWLRGYQISNKHGVAKFTTTYPGWYTGRTPHIHARVRTYSGDTTTLNMTTQFFFDDNISDYVYANYAPYNTRTGTRGTRNSNDNVYGTIAGGGSQLQLRISPNGARLAIASFNIYVS